MATNKVTFEVIVAGVLKLVTNCDLYLNYKRFIYPELFYSQDSTLPREFLRSVLKVMDDLTNINFEENKKMFSKVGIRERVAGTLSEEKSEKFKKTYEDWWVNCLVLEAINDDGAFNIFINYLKTLQFYKISDEFTRNLDKNNIKEASDKISEAVNNISRIGHTEGESFKPGEMLDIISNSRINVKDQVLTLGNSYLDDIFGGFEAQTLNGIIAMTNGGKTMFAHHLIRRCIESGIHVWVGVLEDRKKSFVYKIVSCLSGVSSYDLKRNFSNLTLKQTEAVEKAVRDVERFVKVEFIHGSDITTVHKIALDYDTECRLLNKPVPLVNIVDYTGHIAAKSHGERMYEKIRNAFAARKDFCLKNKKIGFDFAQINRDGSKNLMSSGLVTITDLAGSFDLAQVFDNIISLNRSPDDIQNNVCKIHVCKARDSGAGATVMVTTDFDCSRFNMDSSNLVNMGNAKETGITRIT